jgi:putative exosortase-associated protein (TIGR04073 family)
MALLLASFAVHGEIVYPKDRAERDFNITATEKLDRGFSNLMLFWLEIPHQWYRNSDPVSYNGAGMFKGTFDGLRNGSVRFGQGVFDIATFPWNTPNFELPWSPGPNEVHPEYIPMMEWAIPGADRNDAYQGDGQDLWPSGGTLGW